MKEGSPQFNSSPYPRGISPIAATLIFSSLTACRTDVRDVCDIELGDPISEVEILTTGQIFGLDEPDLLALFGKSEGDDLGDDGLPLTFQRILVTVDQTLVDGDSTHGISFYPTTLDVGVSINDWCDSVALMDSMTAVTEVTDPYYCGGEWSY